MFFKDIDDLKTILSVNAQMDFNQMVIFLNDVDRTILKKYLGSEFLAELQTLFEAENSFDDFEGTEKDLMNLLRVSSANFALAKWIPSGQLSIDDSGIRIANTDTHKTAFPWQIEKLERSVNELGYNALEELLAHLEQHIDDYDTYKASSVYAVNNYLFIKSSEEFTTYFEALNSSRINFIKLRSIIRKVEDFEIKAVILPDFFNDLKTKLKAGDTIGANAQKVIDLIKPALAHLTIAKAVNELSAVITPDGFVVFDTTSASAAGADAKKNIESAALNRIALAAEQDGKSYLKILADFLETNKADYPLFTGDTLYVAPAEQVDVNDGKRNFYIGM